MLLWTEIPDDEALTRSRDANGIVCLRHCNFKCSCDRKCWITEYTLLSFDKWVFNFADVVTDAVLGFFGGMIGLFIQLPCGKWRFIVSFSGVLWMFTLETE